VPSNQSVDSRMKSAQARQIDFDKCREIKPGSRSIFPVLLSHDNTKRIASETYSHIAKARALERIKTKMIASKKFVKK